MIDREWYWQGNLSFCLLYLSPAGRHISNFILLSAKRHLRTAPLSLQAHSTCQIKQTPSWLHSPFWPRGGGMAKGRGKEVRGKKLISLHPLRRPRQRHLVWCGGGKIRFWAERGSELRYSSQSQFCSQNTHTHTHTAILLLLTHSLWLRSVQIHLQVAKLVAGLESCFFRVGMSKKTLPFRSLDIFSTLSLSVSQKSYPYKGCTYLRTVFRIC